MVINSAVQRGGGEEEKHNWNGTFAQENTKINRLLQKEVGVLEKHCKIYPFSE